MNVSQTSIVLLTFVDSLFKFWSNYDKKDKIVTIVSLALHIKMKGIAEFSEPTTLAKFFEYFLEKSSFR